MVYWIGWGAIIMRCVAIVLHMASFLRRKRQPARVNQTQPLDQTQSCVWFPLWCNNATGWPLDTTFYAKLETPHPPPPPPPPLLLLLLLLALFFSFLLLFFSTSEKYWRGWEGLGGPQKTSSGLSGKKRTGQQTYMETCPCLTRLFRLAA